MLELVFDELSVFSHIVSSLAIDCIGYIFLLMEDTDTDRSAFPQVYMGSSEVWQLRYASEQMSVPVTLHE